METGVILAKKDLSEVVSLALLVPERETVTAYVSTATPFFTECGKSENLRMLEVPPFGIFLAVEPVKSYSPIAGKTFSNIPFRAVTELDSALTSEMQSS
jgi:hypothetical protein